MLTLQSVMLVTLGVFAAGFVGLFLAPLYRRRAAKLAIEDLKRSMPLTEAEIRADKDRLRAENAIAIHRLESRLEESGLVAARQRVEINRRDAAISGLESEVSRLGTILDEHENARRVLEQTITERLPMVERRLSEAKELLSQRDREITEISRRADKTQRALEETSQINAKQREELHRLNATLAARHAQSRSSFADRGVETEIALRGEIEALRAKSRDQSELIDQLKAGRARPDKSTLGTGASGSQSKELERLRLDLAEAQQALRNAKGQSEKDEQSRSSVERELGTVKSEAERLRSELSRLKAALNVYEATDTQERATRETKAALKARIGVLESEIKEQTDSIRQLKAEIAAGNDKLARQAAHYVDVIRRLGGGTQPVSATAGRAAGAGAGRAAASSVRNRNDPLLARLNAPRKDGRALIGQTAGRESPATARAQSAERDNAKVSDFIKALGGHGKTAGDGGAAAQSAATNQAATETKAASGNAKAESPSNATPKQRRPGLLERLASSDKPVA